MELAAEESSGRERRRRRNFGVRAERDNRMAEEGLCGCRGWGGEKGEREGLVGFKVEFGK